MRIENSCPRCNRITNQELKIMYDKHDKDGDIIHKVYQSCHNCDLERHGIISWTPWMKEVCNLVLWMKEE